MADSLQLVQRKIEFRQEVLQITESAMGPLTLREMASESDWIDITLAQDMNTLRGIVVALEKDGYLIKHATDGRPSWSRSSMPYDPVDDDIALMEATDTKKSKTNSKADMFSAMAKAKKAADTTHHTVSQKMADELKKLKTLLAKVTDENIKAQCMNILDSDMDRTLNYVREMEIDVKMLNAEKDNFLTILANVTTLITDIA